MKPKKKTRKIRRRVVKASSSLTFTYKKPEELTRYVTEQGSIIPRNQTGLSQKQQKRLAVAIKRARHLAMLPFTQVL
ncbi:30S ribosomal protein S18 [Candidatus Woesebacteria bacterium]|nr:30S ribosomal protein S18 [Candidatus Woesebacteria bacterium]